MNATHAERILRDIQRDVPVAESALRYTPEMRDFRSTVEAEWEAWQAEHSDSVLVMERDFNAKKRAKMADAGTAMPDGSFPIANAEDLSNAVKLAGQAKDPAAAKAHIIKRARALGMTGSLPEAWGIKETFVLSEADRLALKAAGMPVPMLEMSGGHFFGRWAGGKASGGGGPDKNDDGKPDLSAGPVGTNASQGIVGRALGAPTFETSGHRGGIVSHRALGMPNKGHGKMSEQQAETRRLMGIINAPGITFVSAVQREAEAVAFGDIEVRGLLVKGDGSDVTLTEAVVMLDKAPTEAKVMQVGEDILVFPQWTGAFDTLGEPYKKPEPYVPDASADAQWNVSDAADLLRKLASMKRREGDEADQSAMLQTAIGAIADYLKAEADEIGTEDVTCATCDHPAMCDCTTCSCTAYDNHSGVMTESAVAAMVEAISESVGEDSEFAVAIAEVGKRNSAKDAETLRQIVKLVATLGIDLAPEPEPEPVESVAEAKFDEDGNPLSVTFREAGAYGDYVTLAEASPLFDAATRTVWVTPIKPGWGNARDNNYYPVETLREATVAGKFNHLKMYRDHPRKSDEKDLPERSVKDWFATTREAEWDDARQKPRVPIKVHDEVDFNKWQEAPEQVALSIIGGGMARPGEKDGRKGRILESISKVRSVDWVTEAGAGGGIDFAESASSEENEMGVEYEDLTPESLAEGNPALYEHLVGMGKALAGGDAAAIAADKAARKEAKADDAAAAADAGDGKVKESADEVPAWFKPFAGTLEAIATREAAAASASTIEADKAKAKTVVATTLQGSTLTGKAKDIIAARFTEAAIGEGRAYADDDAVKAAVEDAIKEAQALLGIAPKVPGSNVVGLGEGAATVPEGDVSVRESVKADIESRWGTDKPPSKDQLVFSAAEVSGVSPIAPLRIAGAGATDPAPVSEAAASVQAGLAARMGV